MTIAAMVSAGSGIFYRPKDKAVFADNAHQNFHRGNVGDHNALLTVYNSWAETAFSAQWCYENYVQVHSVLHHQASTLCGRSFEYQFQVLRCTAVSGTLCMSWGYLPSTVVAKCAVNSTNSGVCGTCKDEDRENLNSTLSGVMMDMRQPA